MKKLIMLAAAVFVSLGLYAAASAHNYRTTHQQPAEQVFSLQPAAQVYSIQPAEQAGEMQPQFNDDGDCTVQCAANPQQ